MISPDPLQWIWYTFGDRLGPRYRGWVLHDVTSRTRWLRQTVRAVVQVAPSAMAVAAVLCLDLGLGWVVFGGVACGMLLACWYSLAYIDQTGDRRLVKHGYEPGTLKRELQDRYDREHADEIARYMQTYRQTLVHNPIERLAPALGDEGLVMREIWLLRLRALLARAHGDDARYCEYRDRCRDMARTLGFEGHIDWVEAMP